MKQTLFAIAIIGLIAVVITLSLSDLNQSIANRNDSRAEYMDAYGRAQAMIITAQSSAQREFTIAAMPWVVLGIALIAGAVGIALIVRTPTQTGQALIERRIVYYLPQSDVIDLPRRIAEVINERH
jgi:hypothetical protein